MCQAGFAKAGRNTDKVGTGLRPALPFRLAAAAEQPAQDAAHERASDARTDRTHHAFAQRAGDIAHDFAARRRLSRGLTRGPKFSLLTISAAFIPVSVAVPIRIKCCGARAVVPTFADMTQTRSDLLERLYG